MMRIFYSKNYEIKLYCLTHFEESPEAVLCEEKDHLGLAVQQVTGLYSGGWGGGGNNTLPVFLLTASASGVANSQGVVHDWKWIYDSMRQSVSKIRTPPTTFICKHHHAISWLQTPQLAWLLPLFETEFVSVLSVWEQSDLLILILAVCTAQSVDDDSWVTDDGRCAWHWRCKELIVAQ